MKIRWLDIGISFVLACLLWYGVSGSEKMESQLDVRVDYRGLPQGLIIKSGLVSKVTVRVRASAGLLRSISGRDYAFTIDISDLKNGFNDLPIHMTQLPFQGAVEIIEILPSRIQLEVDSITSKEVPLVADITGDLPKDFVAQATFSPATVVLTGAETILSGLDKINVQLRVDSPVLPGTIDSKRLISSPEGVDAKPAEVRVSLHIGVKRKMVTVSRPVLVEAPETVRGQLRPDKVSVTLAVPESVVGKAAANTKIRAFVTVDENMSGSHILPVNVTLPEGAELVRIEPSRVTINLDKK